MFAPRPGSSDEFDGWLLTPTVNLDAGACELVGGLPHKFVLPARVRGQSTQWFTNNASVLPAVSKGQAALAAADRLQAPTAKASFNG